MKSIGLGELEKEIMDIIWQRKECSVREILSELKKTRHLAYTTVATILQRLFDKKMVERKETKSGYIYSAKVSKKTYSRKVAKNFLNKFVDSYGDVAIASFADSIDHLPEEKKEYLLKLLSDYDKT